MQPVAALGVVAYEPQSLLRAILLRPVAAYRAGLRGVIRIHLDRQGSGKRRLVADEGLQFGKRPLRMHAIGGCRALGETRS